MLSVYAILVSGGFQLGACALYDSHHLHLLRRAASVPMRYPAGGTAGATDNGFPEDQRESHAGNYAGPSTDSFRTGSLGTSRRHTQGANRGRAAPPRGNGMNPRGHAAGLRGRGQHAAPRGRGDEHRGPSGGRSAMHSQQTGGQPVPHQPVSASSRQWVEPASQARGKHGSNHGHQRPHRQSCKPENKHVATVPYAQQSGYPC